MTQAITPVVSPITIHPVKNEPSRFDVIKDKIKSLFTKIVFAEVIKTARSLAKLASSNVGIFAAASTHILKGLQGLLPDGKNNVALKQMLASVSLAQSLLQVFPSFFDITDTVNLSSELSNSLKVTDLSASLQYIIDNEKRIRKGLDIAKDTRLQDIAQKYLSDASSADDSQKQEAIQKANQLVKDLKQRVNTKLGLEVVKLVVRVTGIAAASFAAFTSANPASSIAVISVGGASIVLWGIEKLLLNKNAFKEPSGDLYDRLSRATTRGLYAISDALDESAHQVVNGVKNILPSGVHIPSLVSVN